MRKIHENSHLPRHAFIHHERLSSKPSNQESSNSFEFNFKILSILFPSFCFSKKLKFLVFYSTHSDHVNSQPKRFNNRQTLYCFIKTEFLFRSKDCPSKALGHLDRRLKRRRKKKKSIMASPEPRVKIWSGSICFASPYL